MGAAVEGAARGGARSVGWRSAYRRGRKAGRRIFHRERAEWYERATGERLEGSAAEQHARFHDVTRRYRAYTDR